MTDFQWRRIQDERAFFRLARAIHNRKDFDRREREYKFQLSEMLKRVSGAVRSNSRTWRPELAKALRSRQNNIIDWRQVDVLLRFAQERPDSLRRALLNLWSDSVPVAMRIDRFASVLKEAGLSQVGAQLTIASTLLMAAGADRHPPIRTRPFRQAFERSGFPRFERGKQAGFRYRHAVGFLDTLRREARHHGVELRDRLDGQSVIWWMRDGLKLHDLEPDLGTSGLSPDDLAELAKLAKTHRKAVVEARLGQGRFREELIKMWGACAVTRCSNLELLRASHLKPWKKSSDPERLNRFNGLLLIPTLDAALDRGLISFGNDGRILISPLLNQEDRRALEIFASMRLRRKVEPNHREFLAYHRDHVFRRGSKTSL